MNKINLKITSVIIYLLITAVNSYAQLEIEVIPYKIENPSENLTLEHGREYAKLVSLAAAIKKDIIIYPHEKVQAEIKKLSINPQHVITENDLIMIGEQGRADYILLGTLSRSKGNYNSGSVLYSIRDKRIMSKSNVSAGNLLAVAEEEINNIFFAFPDKKRSYPDNHIDAVILLDLSFKIAAEWESIQKGIRDFADTVSDNWSIDTKINIVPYSDKYTLSNKITGLSSGQAIDNKLKQLVPGGTMSYKNFEEALSFSIKNIPWRRNSDKLLIIISNSENTEAKFPQRYAVIAKSKKIAVRTISLGLLKGKALESMKEFSVISAGLHNNVTYHQRFYNEKGNPVDVFYQDGRLFHSLVFDTQWKEGLFTKNKENNNSNWEKPKPFLNEIFFNTNKYNINPYNLDKYYPVITDSAIINSARLENNIDSIMRTIGDTFEYTSGRQKYKKSIAKAQISDGNISLWIRIKTDKDLEFFRTQAAKSVSFPIGAVIQKNPDEPYGISMHPDSYITGFTNDYIPQIVKTSLSAIIKDPDSFMNNGLFTPPVWFMNIKIERIEKYEKDQDIRGSFSP